MAVALNSREYRKFRLIEKKDINHNTISFRFELPSKNHKLGLPVGKHVVVRYVSSLYLSLGTCSLWLGVGCVQQTG